jgi:hypothetical protein
MYPALCLAVSGVKMSQEETFKKGAGTSLSSASASSPLKSSASSSVVRSSMRYEVKDNALSKKIC